MSQKTAVPALILFLLIGLPISAAAQDNSAEDVPAAEAAIEKAPTSAEVMRDRISKAKAMLAVRNFPAAIYELENIKKENTEPAVTRVVNVLLMHAYLELSDYPKAKELLKEAHESKAADSPIEYMAVAGQVVSSARAQADRYRSLGLSINDRNLPTVASADIEGMRSTLEVVIDQSKAMTADEKLKTNAALLLEESSSARGSLARDAYDAKRWKDQMTDAREQMVASRSVVLSSSTPAPAEQPEAEVAALRIESSDLEVVERDQPMAEKQQPEPAATELVAKRTPERRTIPIEKEVSANDSVAKKTGETPPPPVEKPAEVKKPEPKKEPIAADAVGRPVRIISSAAREPEVDRDRSDEPNVKSSLGEEEKSAADANVRTESGPLTIGSLIGYATRRVAPIYPRQARSMRMTGVVTVKIIVDENGSVSDIDDLDGPPLLQRAASDAIRKWKFKPFKRDGEPVKATGFVSFNFDL